MENRKIDWIGILEKLPETFTCAEFIPFSKDDMKAARDCQLLHRMGIVSKVRDGKRNIYTKTHRYPQHAIDYHEFLLKELEKSKLNCGESDGT